MDYKSHGAGLAVLGAGLILFGAILGSVTAMTVTPGISSAFLTGLMGFVGSVLLTFVGFRRNGPRGSEPLVDLLATGVALTCLCIGILTGLATGMSIRNKLSSPPMMAVNGSGKDEPPTRPGAILFGDHGTVCETVGKRLNAGDYSKRLDYAEPDLRNLFEISCNRNRANRPTE